jgi:hypothetical protein
LNAGFSEEDEGILLEAHQVLLDTNSIDVFLSLADFDPLFKLLQCPILNLSDAVLSNVVISLTV